MGFGSDAAIKSLCDVCRERFEMDTNKVTLGNWETPSIRRFVIGEKRMPLDRNFDLEFIGPWGTIGGAMSIANLYSTLMVATSDDDDMTVEAVAMEYTARTWTINVRGKQTKTESIF